MAKLLNKDPVIYVEERGRFIKELRQFHQNKGTPFKNIPTIDGKDVDLYLLYWLVTAKGGWEKVNRKSAWDELLESFEIPDSTVNGAILLKQTYLRYLDTYEKIHYLGEDGDDADDDDWYKDAEDSRSRRQKSQKVQNSIPLSYNLNQHNVSAEVRITSGLSTNLHKKTDYDRLALSLTSPLPNEQDFGINVCTLLSNEGRHTLKLEKCERLLDLLLAHAGVFNHPNLNEYLNGIYRESRGYDLTQFWTDVCRDKIARDLMLNPPTLEPQLSSSKKSKNQRSPNKRRTLIERDNERSQKSLYSKSEKSGVKQLEMLLKQAESDLAQKLFSDDEENSELFACGTRTGTQESAGQRILQIATIIRNLSFEEDNALILSKNLTCLRFCLLCASSRWSNINQMGFDILSNIATQVALQEAAMADSCVTDVLLSTLVTCLSSDDRFQVISSLDVLTKLCSLEINEDFISKMLTVKQTQSLYEQLAAYLSLHDIHLLISTLECLYSLSCIGEATCNCIIRTQGALDTLVSLITVEAQSYGPKACILMRVVETVPGAAALAAAQGSASASIEQQIPHDSISSSASGAISNMPSLQLSMGSKPISQPVTTTIQLQHTQRPNAAVPAPSVQTTNLSGQQNILRGQLVQRPMQVNQQGQVITAPQAMTLGRQQPIQAVNSHTLSNQAISQSSQPSSIVTQQQIIQQPKSNVQQPIVITSQPQQSQQIVVMPQQPSQQQLVSMQQPQRFVTHTGQPVQLQQVQQNSTTLQQPMATQQLPSQNQSQQVQLRVSNDESNRQFCLSWLKATYESSSGSSIDQPVMYKQYLASLHKLGKRDVISQQIYAVCIRTLFGGSVGPIRKQLPNGQFQNVYEGVKLRAQPLPLRVPTSPQQTASQPQTQVIQQHQVLKPNAVPVPNATPSSVSEENGSSVLDGILPKDFGSLTKDEKSNVTFQTNNNGTSVVQNSGNKSMLTQILDGKQTTNNENHVNKAIVNGMTNKTAVYLANNVGVDPIANVKKMNGGMDNTMQNQNVTTIAHNQQSLKRPSTDVDGQSVPKKAMLDPQQLSNGVVNTNGENNVGEMDESNSPILKTDVNLAQAAVNNQGVAIVQQQQNIVQQVSQPEKIGGSVLPAQQTQRILTTADGKQILVKSPAQGNVLTVQPQQLTAQGNQNSQGGKTIIILQPQNKGPNSQVQPSSSMLMTQPTPVSNQGSMQPQVIMQGGQQVGTVTPITYMNSNSLPPASVMAVAGGYVPQNGSPVTHITQPNNTYVNGGQTNSAINNPQTVQHNRHPSGSNVNISVNSNVIRQSPTPPIQGLQQAQQRVQSPLPPSVAASIANVSFPNNASSSATNSNDVSQTIGTNQQNVQQHFVSNSSVSHISHSLPQTPHQVVQQPTTIQPQYVPVPQGVLPPPNPQRPFICEWAGCMKDFRTPKEVEKHAIVTHCADIPGQIDMPCLWSRCDGMKRKRFSLMTHIQDRHCHPQMMKLIAVRRVQMAQTGKTDVPLPPAPPPHPGYAPNAALHAIKRHAQEFATPKAQAMSDEKEGPVTKSIRLTSALILKNLVMCSSLGQKRLKAYESHLATVALSNVESSRTVSQILYEMAECDTT